MDVKEITNLRKAGKYAEALEMARNNILIVSDKWSNMSLFWVLRDMVKNIYVPEGKYEQAESLILEMESLIPNMLELNEEGVADRALESLKKSLIPEVDVFEVIFNQSKIDPIKAYKNFVSKFDRSGKNLNTLLHEDYGWIIYRFLKENADNLDSVEVRRVLKDYILLKNSRPSMVHSMILNFAINFSKSNIDFNLPSFYKLWGYKNLREKDFENNSYEGHEIHSLQYRLFLALADSEFEVDYNEILENMTIYESNFGQSFFVECFREGFFWRIMNHHKQNKIDAIWNDFMSYQKYFSNFESSHWNSEILNLSLRFMDEGETWRFLPFFKEWDYKKLRDEDWEDNKGRDGKTYSSLACKCAKKCFEIVKTEILRNSDCQSDVEWLFEFFKIVVERCPKNDWLKRNYAMINFWRGYWDNALAIYKELVPSLGNQFYLWKEMAECIKDNDQLKIGLLLKAVSLKCKEDYIGDVHLELAKYLIDYGVYNEASKHLKKYLENREKNKWNISPIYEDLSKIIVSNEGRNDKYLDISKTILDAENFVYDNCESGDFILLEKWVKDNVEKSCFYNSAGLTIKVKSKHFPCLRKAKIGEIFHFRYYVKEDKTLDAISHENRILVVPLMCIKTEMIPWSLFPLKYGVVDYVNRDKSTLHILTTDSETSFYKYSKDEYYEEGTLVNFREYIKDNNNRKIKILVDLQTCSLKEIDHLIDTRIGVVDDVNNKKELFHITLGRGMVSDVVRYCNVKIRPQIGDFLVVKYIIKENKDGSKRIRFIDLQKTENENSDLKVYVEGILRVKYKGIHSGVSQIPDYAFVENYYVHHDLLVKYNICQDCEVIAKAVLGGDDKMKIYDIQVLDRL